jgi:hypothetical protein
MTFVDWLWSETRYAVHNLVAHPLLVLWPRAGEWLHKRTLA